MSEFASRPTDRIARQPGARSWLRRALPIAGLAVMHCAPAAVPEQALDVVALDYAYRAPDSTGQGQAPVAPATRAPDEVLVDAGDYAFHLPDTLPAGVTDFRMRNTGQQRHEVSLVRLAPGISAAYFLAESVKGTAGDSVYDGDGALLTAYPGDDNRTAMRVDLLPGRTYVLVCEFQDAPDKPRHIALGMFKEIVVRPR